MKNPLKNLFGTKAKVLELFFQRAALVLPVEDIGKRTGFKKRAAGVIISDLVKLGILKKVNGNGQKKKSKKGKNK